MIHQEICLKKVDRRRRAHVGVVPLAVDEMSAFGASDVHNRRVDRLDHHNMVLLTYDLPAQSTLDD